MKLFALLWDGEFILQNYCKAGECLQHTNKLPCIVVLHQMDPLG